MQIRDLTILITGGAGLVGSHLADQLLQKGATVRVVDNLSKGFRNSVPDGAAFIKADLTDLEKVSDIITSDLDIIIHLAAYTDTNYDNDRKLFEENNSMTYNLLECMDEVNVNKFVFTSSSAIYGEAPRPTPEDYGTLEPISIYGSAKLSDEALISTYAHSYNIQSWIFRFANIVGPYQRGNVVPDFIEKLDNDSSELTILGNGLQEKSYMHVSECVDAMQYVIKNANDDLNVYNLGTESTTSVTEIADIISDELNIDPNYNYTGGDRGWIGDVSKMRLSIYKLVTLGWEPSMSSDESIRRSAQELIDEIIG